MRVELKDFQARAVSSLAEKLANMRAMHEATGQVSSVCLAAPTGSGKTVMCAATIEALFFGDDDLGLPPDEDAVVLWLSESPSLNDQTRARFVGASEKLADWFGDMRHLETVRNDFGASHEVLEPRHVYFLSKDLLGKNGLLTRGGETNGGRVFWDILDRTIRDPARSLYLFIDEAHRGLGGKPRRDDGSTATIYANLIDGLDGRAPAPVVVGVSATPQRFEEAMGQRRERVRMPRVEVTPREVQESGLLKDVIELRVPEKDDPVEHQYLTMACERFRLACDRWDSYCTEQGERTISPLMLVQVKDGASADELREMCEQISGIVPGLSESASFANVFGEHKDMAAGRYLLPYVPPEQVQERTVIRVLFAKEAVSNGWDCPRAEVIFSQRRRSDSTYIAQLVGRMVRTPLARRIDSDELLNAVACYLPQFNPESTQDVVDYLTGKRDAMGESSLGRQNIVLNPVTVEAAEPYTQEDYERDLAAWERNREDIARNEKLRDGYLGQLFDETRTPATAEPKPPAPDSGPEGSLPADLETSVATDFPAHIEGEAGTTPTPIPMPKPKPPTPRGQAFTHEEWEGMKAALASIPVLRNPKKALNEFRSLLNTATLLVEVGLDRDAANDVNRRFVQALTGAMSTHEDEYLLARHDVEVSETVKITLDRLHGTQSQEQEDARTDPEGLKKASREADRRFGREFAQAYRRRYIEEVGRAEVDLRLAAAVRVPEIVSDMEKWAADTRAAYFDDVDGSGRYDFLTDAEKQRYDELARETSGKRLTRIEWPRATSLSDNHKKYPKHIVQKPDGLCPLDLGSAEDFVVESELAKPYTVGFYRNPSKSNSPQAFSIPYNSSVGRKALHPDFIFFVRDGEGIKPSIVDPHGEFLGDTLAKLRGYVAYLREYPDIFKQVLFVGDMGNGEYRVLNLLRDDVQAAIEAYSDVDCKALFYGSFANTYH